MGVNLEETLDQFIVSRFIIYDTHHCLPQILLLGLIHKMCLEEIVLLMFAETFGWKNQEPFFF